MSTTLETAIRPIHPQIQQLVDASCMAKLSDEEQEIRFERSDVAALSFRQLLSASQRFMLLKAASCSNKLFLALSSGDWENAVRALRGYVARAVPQTDWPEYRELIVALNILTPHALEATGHKQVVEDDEHALVAAAA